MKNKLFFLTIVIALSMLGTMGPTPATAAEGIPAYSVQFLGEATVTTTLNAAGKAVGWTSSSGAVRAWVSTDAGTIELLPLPPGILQSRANDINDAGVVVGSAWTDIFNDPGRAMIWRPTASGYEVIELSTFEGDTKSAATAINNGGQIVGTRSFLVNNGGRITEATRGFRYTEGIGVEDLSALGFTALPSDINDLGQIVGGSQRLTDGVVEDLGAPAGSFLWTVAYAINNNGQVTGYAQIATSLPDNRQIVRYTDGIGWEILGGLGPYDSGYGINSAGDVSLEGNVCPSPSTFRAGVYLQGLGLLCLDDLLAEGYQDWSITATFDNDINDSGQIVAIGTNSVTGESGVVLLTPTDVVPPQPTPTPTPQPTMTPTPTPQPTATPEPTPTPDGCADNCLRSTNISLSARERRGSVRVTGKVTVEDENGTTIEDAAVYATWTLPDGTAQDQTATTNSEGVARFRVRDGHGTYTLTVVNITKAGYTFDPDNSVLSESISK